MDGDLLRPMNITDEKCFGKKNSLPCLKKTLLVYFSISFLNLFLSYQANAVYEIFYVYV